MNKRAPLFKKMFAAGSVEEEALQLLMHEKKIQEMENELRTLLNFRYGHRTWEQMIEMRRKIVKQREREVYRREEMKRQMIEIISVVFLIALIGTAIVFFAYLYTSNR
jgi:phage-related tail protein